MENNQENSPGIAEQVEKILAESRVIYGGIGGSTGVLSAGNGATISTAAPYWDNSRSTVMAGQLDLKGSDADININGVSLTKTLYMLQERLNILVPNTAMEKEWNELKELGDRYRKLSAEFEEKSRMWQALKKIE